MANKILIIDDNREKRLFYEQEFTRAGYEVITRSDCVGILEIIAWHKPDLIILSIKEKAEKELGTLEEIRSARYETPVILSTEYLSLETMQSLLRQIERSHEVWLNELL